MASCTINITGTSGTVLIKYNLGGVSHSMTGSFGETIYINDAATGITVTNISGNAGATSSCVTLTNLSVACYLVSWGQDLTPISGGNISFQNNIPYIFNAVMLGTEALTLPDTNYFVFDLSEITKAINDLNDSRVRAVAYKRSQQDSLRESFIMLKVTGPIVPELRLRNPAGDHLLFLKGVVSSNCLPAGYTAISACLTDPS